MTLFLGIGSNIEAERNIRQAAVLIKKYFPTIRFSSVYTSKATDLTDQADFLNAVAMIETEQLPEQIQKILNDIEQTLGKNISVRFGPRTIDLDILLCDDCVYVTKELTIPHPRMHERRFVLEPLLELIDPDGLHPVLGRSWKELRRQSIDQRCEKTAMGL